MPKMLAGNGQKGWPYVQRLQLHLFQFMEPPFLRNAKLGVPVWLFSSGFGCLQQYFFICYLAHRVFWYFYPRKFISCIKEHLGCC